METTFICAIIAVTLLVLDVRAGRLAKVDQKELAKQGFIPGIGFYALWRYGPREME